MSKGIGSDTDPVRDVGVAATSPGTQRRRDLASKIEPKENREEANDEIDHDFESLEYEEDVYYTGIGATPSFDDIDELLSDSDEVVVHCWRGSNGDIEEIVVDDPLYCLHDFHNVENDLAGRKIREQQPQAPKSCGVREKVANGNEKKKKKSIRLIFQELSRPYLEKINSSPNYRRFIEIVKGEEASSPLFEEPPDSAHPLSEYSFSDHAEPQERELQIKEWTAELAKVEEEIQTLRHVLASKVRVSQELKRKLGIGAWKELTDDVNQGLRNVKESQVFQKTESVIKTTAEKTTSILGGFSSGITSKLGQMRNSESFRSLEEKVGSAYENVKTKVVPSRSNSTQSFDEALKEAEATRRASAAPCATSPTIPEGKALF
ncbi:uncharacterized protein LOC105686744 [Athalia rosae]|uniref:uncharacterized protein LOC105686744 n=1 Tax=Athalia rosae TaxID=37344 RepID=UPI0020349305|nr:uncharacterized protein LOC105686744 [Athalia rosae]